MADQSEAKKFTLTYVDAGIKVEHNFTSVTELAHASLTLVRAVGESLKPNPDAHRRYVQFITEAAFEGGTTEEQAQ